MKLSEIAAHIGAVLDGVDCDVLGLASNARANATHLSFVMPGRAIDTQAGALILTQKQRPDWPGAALVVDDVYLAYARASALFAPALKQPAIDPTASIHPTAKLADGVSIGPFVVIEAGVSVGANTVVGPQCFLGANSTVGEGSQLHARVTLYHDVAVGAQAVLHSGVVLGADGFGFASSAEGWVKIHQLGGVVLGKSVEIGANTCVDRGALDDTTIGDGVKIDDQVMIAHNCEIGDGTAIAACVGMAGSTRIGRNCTIGGAAGFTGHLSVCDNVHIGAMTLVAGNVSTPGAYAGGVQGARPMNDWKKNVARFNQLDQLARRLMALEKHHKDS